MTIFTIILGIIAVYLFVIWCVVCDSGKRAEASELKGFPRR